jgi:hypothetical protein
VIAQFARGSLFGAYSHNDYFLDPARFRQGNSCCGFTCCTSQVHNGARLDSIYLIRRAAAAVQRSVAFAVGAALDRIALRAG